MGDVGDAVWFLGWDEDEGCVLWVEVMGCSKDGLGKGIVLWGGGGGEGVSSGEEERRRRNVRWRRLGGWL